MCLSQKKNNPILHLLVDYTVFISICKATKQDEILQEGFSLIFYHLNNFYRTAMYKKRQRGTHHIAEHKKTIRLGKLPHYEGNLQGDYPKYLSKMLTLASSRRRRKARSLI